MPHYYRHGEVQTHSLPSACNSLEFVVRPILAHIFHFTQFPRSIQHDICLTKMFHVLSLAPQEGHFFASHLLLESLVTMTPATMITRTMPHKSAVPTVRSGIILFRRIGPYTVTIAARQSIRLPAISLKSQMNVTTIALPIVSDSGTSDRDLRTNSTN
jgi:hypothetical protein